MGPRPAPPRRKLAVAHSIQFTNAAARGVLRAPGIANAHSLPSNQIAPATELCMPGTKILEESFVNRALAGALTLCAALAVSSCGGGGSSDAPVPAIRSMPPLAAAAAIPAGVDATALMDAAERIYPSLFPGHQANQFYSPFVYRQYANGNDLGVAGDVIYIRGSVAGGSIPVSVGTL